MCSPWISGGRTCPGVCQSAQLCWDGSTAGREQGKCRETALNCTDRRVTQQGKHSWRIPSAAAGSGWERLGSQGPPAPSSEALGCVTHSLAGLCGVETQPELPRREGAAAPTHTKSREEFLLLAPIQKHRGSCWEKRSLTG